MDMYSESLQELLVSLRQHSTGDATPAHSSTASASIPALPLAFHRGDVIEIQGPASSGKTHLLYHILSSFLAPDTDAQIAVVVYDTDASFDIHRFRHLLISRLPSNILDPHDIVRRSLARLHVFRPSSLAQLAVSIANLPAYHSSRMPNQEIAVLAIDSISSFYWADRFAAEQLRNVAPEKAKMLPLYHRVFSAIQAVRRSHRPVVVLTNWALNPAPSHSGSLYRQHLHSFLVLEDAIADLGAKASNHNDTDHSSSSPFRLTHHIALSSPSSGPSSVAPLDDAVLHETRHRKQSVGNRPVSCLTRFSGTRDTVRFTLQIMNDDILVQQ